MLVSKQTWQTAFTAIVAVTLWNFVKAKFPAVDPDTYLKA